MLGASEHAINFRWVVLIIAVWEYGGCLLTQTWLGIYVAKIVWVRLNYIAQLKWPGGGDVSVESACEKFLVIEGRSATSAHCNPACVCDVLRVRVCNVSACVSVRRTWVLTN